MEHTNNPSDTVIRLIGIISKKWMLLLFHEFIVHKELRFNELKKNIPNISSKMLSQRLVELEGLGFIERKVIQKKPIGVTYIAKEKIEDIFPLFRALLGWSQKWDIK